MTAAVFQAAGKTPMNQGVALNSATCGQRHEAAEFEVCAAERGWGDLSKRDGVYVDSFTRLAWDVWLTVSALAADPSKAAK